MHSSNTGNLEMISNNSVTRMWGNVQRNGRPAGYRWCSLFNDAKLQCR